MTATADFAGATSPPGSGAFAEFDDEAWSINFLIITMVYLIDWLSGLIRQRLIGKTEQAR